MHHRLNTIVALGAVALFGQNCARGDITLIGAASIPGNATDKSGLTDVLPNGVPNSRLGSFGSAIDYTGKDDLYIAADDRGPSNGDVPFRARTQTFRIIIDPAAQGTSSAVRVELVATTLLSDESGRPLVGASTAFDAKDQKLGLRYDAEGIRVSHNGTMFISDEYGPWIDEFGMDGKRVRRLAVPEKFMVEHPSADAKKELTPLNTKGRQANRGFEGLAITPDGSTLWAILQSPLIQDGGLSDANKRVGVNCRILEIETGVGGGGQTREFVYPLESHKHGVNEMIAINDHEFLVLERDSKTGDDAKMRALYRIDVSGATDVSGVVSLPKTGLPPDVKPVKKTMFLDFTDKKFGLTGPTMPEKIEGLAWGPTLPDGRRTLVVTSDNDVLEDVPSWFWVFAIDAKDLEGKAG